MSCGPVLRPMSLIRPSPGTACVTADLVAPVLSRSSRPNFFHLISPIAHVEVIFEITLPASDARCAGCVTHSGLACADRRPCYRLQLWFFSQCAGAWCSGSAGSSRTLNAIYAHNRPSSSYAVRASEASDNARCRQTWRRCHRLRRGATSSAFPRVRAQPVPAFCARNHRPPAAHVWPRLV